jgi:predicted RNA binding protein YcfA (HicA-like mRNA interferase family)
MPQVTATELVRFLTSQGFVDDRQQGSHLTMRHPERGISVTVPVHPGIDVVPSSPCAFSRTPVSP